MSSLGHVLRAIAARAPLLFFGAALGIGGYFLFEAEAHDQAVECDAKRLRSLMVVPAVEQELERNDLRAAARGLLRVRAELEECP